MHTGHDDTPLKRHAASAIVQNCWAGLDRRAVHDRRAGMGARRYSPTACIRPYW